MNLPRPRTAPDASCGCPDAQEVSRRTLLRGAAIAGALGTAMTVAGPDSFSRYAFAAPGYTGDTLVVLSLRGGFDGLNAVAPVNDPNYSKLRPTLAVPTSAALQLDGTFGLHPALGALKPLWDNGTLAAVHDVGQSNPTRSHFEAMEELERAAPGSSLRTGWLDRVLATRETGNPFQACQVGSTTAAPALAGPIPAMTMYRLDNTNLSTVWDADSATRWNTALTGMYASAPSSMKGPASTMLAALQTMDRIREVTAPEPAVAYPTTGAVDKDGKPVLTELAASLRDVARLIRAGAGLQVACVDWGDWDMHVDAGGIDKGWMFDKFTELSQALAAFAADLGPALFGKTTLVTLSEFGRRVEENGSGGFDHGHGNAMFVLGGGINGGRVYGSWPGLTPDVLVQGDLPGRTDYRQVLGEILTTRCGAGSLSSVFPGFSATGNLGVAKPS